MLTVSAGFKAPIKSKFGSRELKKEKQMEGENSKVVRQSDIDDRLAVPQSWMNILRPLFGNGQKEVLLRALCWLGYVWDFRCAIRGKGRYEKPVLQAPEWQRFVNHVGLRDGDKIVLQAEENHVRGINYHIRAQRRNADGLWVDLQPPRRAAPALHQFNI